MYISYYWYHFFYLMNWSSRRVCIILQCQFPCSVRPTAITCITTATCIETTTMTTLTTTTTIATTILATGKSGQLYRVTLPPPLPPTSQWVQMWITVLTRRSYSQKHTRFICFIKKWSYFNFDIKTISGLFILASDKIDLLFDFNSFVLFYNFENQYLFNKSKKKTTYTLKIIQSVGVILSIILEMYISASLFMVDVMKIKCKANITLWFFLF